MRNLLFVALLGLVVYTVIDVARSEADERYGISRPLWILLIVLVPVLGSIAWLVARSQARSRGAGGGSGGSRVPRPGPRRPPGPVAPDDDPDFLWRLEQMRRRAEAEGGRGAADDGAPPATGAGGPPPADDASSGTDHDAPGHGSPDPRAGG